MEVKTEGRESKGFVILNGCQLENWQNNLNHQGPPHFHSSQILTASILRLGRPVAVFNGDEASKGKFKSGHS